MPKIRYANEIVSKSVKQFRIIERGISLRDAEKESKISMATISRIENKFTPDLPSLIAVCNWASIPIENCFEQIPSKSKKK